MTKFPNSRILILDIETDSTSVDEANLKYFGAYSYITDERYYLKGHENFDFIQEMIDNHDIIVGFNQNRFDIPILERHGFDIQGKLQIDLWEILSDPRLDAKTKERTGGKGRGAYMGLKLNSWSLKNIVKALKLGEYKGDIDYSLFEKEEWTKEEEEVIVEYLAQDITITKRLFEYTHNFYYPFTEHLSEKNILNFSYMRSSVASLAYKIICHEAGLDETYAQDAKRSWKYEGGYVQYPTKEKHVGEILCMDFNSLYPSIFRGFNLFSPSHPKDTRPIFMGNDLFDIKGEYYSDEQGAIEKVVAKLYGLRKEYKKDKDRREYLIKIIINSLYGITAKPVFEQVYSRYGAEDCTYIGRTMIKHVATTFTEKGFEVLYGDTDSVYVALNDKTKEDALKLASELDKYFKSKMPFPHEDFGLGLDAELKAMFFFDAGDNTYKKKNYVYITKDDKLKIMGLPIIKSNASAVATRILREHLVNQIINKKEIQFPKGYIKQLIEYELSNDLGLAVQTYKVKNLQEYDNKTSLYAQISEKYGGGTIGLIPNNKYGIGKAKKYCTVEEFKENKLQISDIDMTVTMNNLEPFISHEQTNLTEFGV